AYNPRIPGVFINSSNVTVKRFTIKNSSEASGILIQEKIQKIRYITIQECDIKNNGGNGVSLDGALLKPPGIEKRSIPSIDSVIIHGCRITNNGGNGVYSQEADVERITSCNISDNRGNGIHIESSPVTIMMENHIERNGRCGIYIKGSHTAWLGIVFVQENHIANNAEEGLHFADYALAVFVNRNTFSENNKRGYQLVADLYGPPPLPWYVHNNQWEPKKFYARLWRIIRLPCS
ncbi:MAG TPA: right-handed parallel beta-helix repeat-containing protein, partial [Thermoplasmata archaeon]|nr:right-handed parallel beta-helix repeat-containing protein [Thermoplasmata archaeon]